MNIYGVCATKKLGNSFPLVACTSQPRQHLAFGKGWGKKLFCCVPQPRGRRALGSQVKWEPCLLPTGPCRGSSGQTGKQPIVQVPILVVQSPVSSAAAAVALAACSASTESESKTPLYVEGLQNCVPNYCQKGTKTVESLIKKVICNCSRKKKKKR